MRIHRLVSTVVLLALLGVILYFKNVSPSHSIEWIAAWNDAAPEAHYGWPWPVARAPSSWVDYEPSAFWKGLNLLVALGILVGSAYVWLRFFVRRSNALNGERGTQFHLSTLLAVCIAAGGLLALNTRLPQRQVEKVGRVVLYLYFVPQFPIGRESCEYYFSYNWSPGIMVDPERSDDSFSAWLAHHPDWRWNLPLWAGMLYVSGVAAEAWARRRT